MDRLDARAVQAMDLAQSGEAREAIAIVDAALQDAAASGREDLLPRLHYIRGVAHHSLGEHHLAVGDCERLLRIAEERQDLGWSANARALRAAQYVLLGDPDEGIRDLVAAQVDLDLADDIELYVRNWAHTGLAIGFDRLRLYELARPHYLAAREIGDAVAQTQPESATIDHLNLAEMHLRWGLEAERSEGEPALLHHAETALGHARDAQMWAKTLTNPRWAMTADLFTGAALALLGEPVEAVALLRPAIDATLGYAQPAEATLGLVMLSRALESLDRRDDAERAARYAEELMPANPDWPLLVAVQERLARLAATASPEPGTLLALRYADTLAREVWAQRRRTLRAAEAQLAVEAMRAEHAEARRASTEDPLTGVSNRRFLDERLTRLAETSVASPHPISAIMLDVDRFKSINDTLGHATGDDVLRAVTRVLVDHARATDVVARYGGDEFILLLTDTGAEEAAQVAQRLLTALRETNWAAMTRGEPVTVSIGTATRPNLHGGAELIQLADDAMYVAKRGGGNQVHSL